jgi:hypothetical protein
LGNFLHGNRETSVGSEKNQPDRSGKDEVHNPDMNAAEESDRLEVPEEAANKVKAKESLEGRSRAKENAQQCDAGSTQSEQTVRDFSLVGKYIPALYGGPLGAPMAKEPGWRDVHCPLRR